MSMTYGIQIKDHNDPFIDMAEAALISASLALAPGAFLVDVIPILKYIPEFIPGAGFQKNARIWRKLQENMREQPYLASIESMVFKNLLMHHLSQYELRQYFLFRRPAKLDLHSCQWLWGMLTKVIIPITN